MLRILVFANRDVLRVRTEATNQVVRIKVDIRRVIEDTHIVHNVSRILAHRFNASESCEGGPHTEDAESNTNCSSRS